MSAEVEYRVVWKREGQARKSKTFATERGATRRLNIMVSDEPWRFYSPPVDPDERVCCAGDYNSMCGCGGMTYREQSEHERTQLDKIEYARMEARDVGEWRAAVAP